MSSAREDWDIFMNVLSRVGLHGDAVREFARAKSTLNGLKTFTEINPPKTPDSATTLLPGGSPISSQGMSDTPQTNTPTPVPDSNPTPLVLP